MKSPAPEIGSVCDDVVDALRRGNNVYVEGPVGSGRNSLVEMLRARCNVVVLDLLPLQFVDATAVSFVDFASVFPSSDRPWLQGGDDDNYHQLARMLCDRLVQQQQSLVIRMPASWARITERSEDDGTAVMNARAWFGGLVASGRSVVIVADAAITPKQLGLHQWQVHRLDSHRVSAASLEGVQWGAYADAFQRLCSGSKGTFTASPIAWRLAVGLVALGQTPSDVFTVLRAQVQLHRLGEELGRLASSNASLAASLRAALAVRRPMGPSQLLAAVTPPEEHETLFTQCIGYGDEQVRIAGPVHAGLDKTLASVQDQQSVHNHLANHYQSLDGKHSARDLDRNAARAWCEKVHHFARSGELGADAWGAQELIAPEQYWERARALSHGKRYLEAAQLYQDCVRRFPKDDYAWHYHGWNLHKAQGGQREVEHSYRTAVNLAPENPWWNSRLVTFLIECGQPGSARNEWKATIERVDADGEELGRTSWLGRHLHKWVAAKWLGAGRASYAASILDTIPQAHITEHVELRQLAEDIKAADPTEGCEAPSWAEFLKCVDTRCEITQSHAEQVRLLWSQLRAVGGPDLPLPMAERTADEERMQFCWNYESVLLEIEVDADGFVQWFAVDRTEGSHGSGETNVSSFELPNWLERVIDG